MNYSRYKPLELPIREKAQILSEINTNYTKYEGKPLCIHMSYGIDNRAYWYYFENYGFDNYLIYGRVDMTEEA